MATQTTITPHNQKPYVSRKYPSESELDGVIKTASAAQKKWAKISLTERIAIGHKFIVSFLSLVLELTKRSEQNEFRAMSDEIPQELTLQMGRPITQAAGEIRGFLDRAQYMLSIASTSLAPTPLPDTPGFKRYIKRTPLGVVLVIAPWNFPYLVSINSVLPALIAGNSVLLKPSPQTPLTAERFALALTRAGVPQDVIQVVHLDPGLTKTAISSPNVDFVSFTGSVNGGRFVEEIAVAADGFKGVALEVSQLLNFCCRH